MQKWIPGIVAAVLLLAGSAQADTVRERILRSYDAVTNLSCEIRRDTPLPDGGTLRRLSRVYYQRPDRLHVEGYSPFKRRIVCDGTVFRSYTEGAPQGFSRPVADLTPEMLRNLRIVPGSPADVLDMLDGTEELPLGGTEEFPARVAYDNDKSYAVLSLDNQGRLARFELFASPAMTDLTTRTDYSAWQEAAPGAWIPCRQESKVRLEGVERSQTTRVDNLAANGDIPASLFEADAFFPNVEFVDAFEKIGR